MPKSGIILPFIAMFLGVSVMVFLFQDRSVVKASDAGLATTQNVKAGTQESAKHNSMPAASMETVLNGLRQRLEREPDDVEGWVLLSKSYRYLQRGDEAEAAMARAKALGYRGPGLPGRGNSQEQVAAAPAGAPSQDMSQKVRQVMKGPAAGSGGIAVAVSMPDELQKTLPATAAVFIFVRDAAQSAGPPLAVLRKQVQDLPLNVVLDDSMAMMPSRTLSSAENVVVGARVSLSGRPMAQAGDYQGLSNSIPATYSGVVELLVSEKLQ